MKPADLLNLLTEFYRDKLALVLRHEAGSRLVGEYDFNNTYQYILAREDAQLSWVRTAIEESAGQVPDRSGVTALPLPAATSAKSLSLSAEVMKDDATLERAFVDRWRSSVDAMSHARHQLMLRVILGESLEHQRFFEQALAGRTDLLGRRADGAGTDGAVLPTRWLE